MIDSHKYISTQIEKEIPQYIRMEYPNFVAFIKGYYEWMEQEGYPYHFIANTLNYADVDRTSLELLDKFGENFLQTLPDLIYDQNNIATLVKNIEQYYSAKGSEKAFEFMFRLFEYKEDALKELEMYYPSYDMLRVSDGKWVNEKSIKIIGPESPSGGDSAFEIFNKTRILDEWKVTVQGWESGFITGDISNAQAVIDEVQIYESSLGLNIAEIFLLESDVIHTPEKFVSETFTVVDINQEVHTDNTESIFYSISVITPGKYYVPNKRIEVTCTGDGEDANVTTGVVSKGSVSGLTIVNGGLGYNVNDEIQFDSSGFGAGAHGIVSDVDDGTEAELTINFDGDGTLGTITVDSGGDSYAGTEEVTIDEPNIPNSTCTMDITTDGDAIDSVVVVNGGYGYAGTETIAVSGLGTGAVITFGTITNGVVQGAVLSAGGTGYIGKPVVLIDEPTIPVVQATADLTFTADVITAVTVTEDGYGYDGNEGYTLEAPSAGAGTILAVQLTSAGFNYGEMPFVTVKSLNGSDAVIMSESDDIGLVETALIRDFGINYITAETTLVFNTMMRVYSIENSFQIGEEITNGTDIGIVEHFDEIGNVMSVRMTFGAFEALDVITGAWNFGSCVVYDVSLASGTMTDGIVCNHEGRYINTDGHISSDKYIQDSYFYQVFSYMIKTDMDKADWLQYISDVHPAGTVVLSYEDAKVQYIKEIYSNEFISPTLDSTEYYKFIWDSGSAASNNNTQIKQYSDCVIGIISNIDDTLDYIKYNKTNLTFGSEITVI